MNAKDLLIHLKDILKGYFYSSALGFIELDLIERKNLFGILVFSPLTGIPLIPAGISLELLPYMEENLIISLKRNLSLDDAIGIIGGRFDIE